MTCGAQTVWIVGAILAVGLAILFVLTRYPEGHPYEDCQLIFGDDRSCKAMVDARAMMRGGVY